jgi:hypothetical protein
VKAIALGLGAGALASRSTTALANSDCAKFCKNLPPGQRGQCVSACRHGTGLFFECGGDPGLLCLATDGQSATCCGTDDTCQDGSCVAPGCPDNYEMCEASGDCVSTLCGVYGQYDPETCSCVCNSSAAWCAAQNQCVSTFCNSREQYNPDTCECECEPQYIPLVNTGSCATPCTSDADCNGVPGGCRTNVEGQQVCGHCGESAYKGCTDHYPCTDSAFCQSCASAINTYCAEGVCYTAC